MIGDGIFYVKLKDEADSAFQDMTVKWRGLVVQKIEGLASLGEPKNVFVQEWVNSDVDDVIEPDTIYRKTNDIEITFYISDFEDQTVDPMSVHASFINYMTSKKVSIWSKYLGYSNDFMCLSSYEPSSYKLKRPVGSNFIQGTLKLHQISSVNTRRI